MSHSGVSNLLEAAAVLNGTVSLYMAGFVVVVALHLLGATPCGAGESRLVRPGSAGLWYLQV